MISALAMLLAIGLGLVLALTRLYGPKPLSSFATTYVELFRGTPVLLQLYVLYYGLMPTLRRLLERLRPDLLHAHYASGYGTTAMLSGWQPLMLSVWGADVYDFPNESAVKRILLVRKDLPVNTLAEFVAYTKANHAKMQYGSSGIGGGAHVCSVLLDAHMGLRGWPSILRSR